MTMGLGSYRWHGGGEHWPKFGPQRMPGVSTKCPRVSWPHKLSVEHLSGIKRQGWTHGVAGGGIEDQLLG